ncbi:hypothetical protein SDC9_155546 [bioreactor metagenome]|uniref:Uncharacterized protein n=1 Tax=bioreactor metagenome TaxID=1076179 RepID=A0A645F6M7_9ZZZZ
MLVEDVVLGGFIVAHVLVSGPVVLSAVDNAGLNGLLHVVGADAGHGGGAQQLNHALHHLVILHADLQACHVGFGVYFLRQVEAAAAGVIIAQADQAGVGGLFDFCQEVLADFAVQHGPHMRAALVQVRHLDAVDGGHKVADRGSGYAGKSQIAKLEGLDGIGFCLIQGAAGEHFDLDAAFGLFFDQAGKLMVCQSGGVAFSMHFGQLQNSLR